MQNSIIATLILIRAVNLPIIFLGSLLGSFIATPNREMLINANVWLLSFGSLFLAAAANTINDILDIEIDKINRPTRPLVTKAISLTSSYLIYSFSILLGVSLPLIASFNLSTHYPFLIAAFLAFSGTLYSFYFKQTPLFGNCLIALDVSLILALGATSGIQFCGSFGSHIFQSLIYAMLFAFFSTLLRELLKDMQDLKGDSNNHAKTFPVLFGISKSSYLLLGILTIVVLLSLFPFLQGIWGYNYLAIVLISDGLMIYGILRIHHIRNNEALFFQKVGKSSLLLKLSMVIGLMAIFIGVLTKQ